MKSGSQLTDHLASFERGVNGGLSPLLLPKNTLAFALNATVRGGFITNRPPLRRQLTYNWPSPEVQTAVQTGLFQGACYYSPDSGPQCLIASISGRLYQFAVSGDVITVTDITIPGDPNPAATTQAWLWQSEQFVIVNDGLSLPIFYDGNVSRRSTGASISLINGTGTVTATAPATTPKIGDTFVLTLSGDYTGPFNKPVLFHGEYYQAIDVSEEYHVFLKTLYDPTAGHAANTDIVAQPSVAGYLTQALSNPGGGNIAADSFQMILTLSTPYVGAIGSLLSITGQGHFVNGQTTIWRVVAKSGNTATVRNNAAMTGNITATGTVGWNYPVGTPVMNSGSTAPNVIVAELKEALAKLPIGTETNVKVRDLYTGPENQIVFIDGAQFSIRVAPTVPAVVAPNTVTLMNLSDASGVDLSSPSQFPLTIVSVPELPAGRMGAYGMTQNWVSLVDGKSFIVSDPSRGPSGTAAYDYRDSVLKTTELTFNGGSFAIPSSGVQINSITFTAKMDESLGQGPLQIGTDTGIFSVNAPFDFANPPPLNTPILPEVVKGFGPRSQNGTVLVNSDTFFRNPDGLATFIQARRDFTSWGNAGISDEVNERILDLDNQSLLPYGSAIVFDNRFITTVSPQSSSNGVIHAGAVVINLDPVSSLSGKSESVYDGLWTGVNALQFITGLFDGESRAFAFGYNLTTLQIEIYEILPSKTENQFDNGYIPITWGFESAALFNKDIKPNEQLIRLRDGEFTVDRVVGRVKFKTWYRFDSDCWTPWHEFSVCAEAGSSPETYVRLGLGEPSGDPCNQVNNLPSREGYTAQVKFQITGHCRFLRARFQAVTIDSPEFAQPICNANCT